MIVSLDHSPQEHQLADHRLHTLALVASPTGHQWGWSEELGLAMRSQSGRLKKWSARTNKRYQASFAQHFPELLAHSDVWVMARTATVDEIRSRALIAAREYGFSEFLDLSGPNVALGPTAKGVSYVLPTKVVLSMLATIDFIVRMHRELHDRWSDTSDWQISPDTPPGGDRSAAANVFSTLVNTVQARGLVNGRLFVHTHRDGDQGADLADNVAGLLRATAEQQGTIHTASRPACGAIYWER